MKRLAFLVVLLVALSATTASAWVQYLDGSAVPSFDGSPWNMDRDGASAADGMITMSGYSDMWIGTGDLPVMVAAGRFKVDSMGSSGMTALMTCTASTDPVTPLGFGILDNGHFALVDYSGGFEAGTNNPLVLQDLGVADSAWHTAYLLSAAGGEWQAAFDGTMYSGTMTTNPWGEPVGYAEFSSGSYWMNTRSATVSFDWLGYGDASDMVPEPGSLVALGCGLIGMLGAIRRRK